MTKTQQQMFFKFLIKGYKTVHNNRGGRGICICIKDSINYEQVVDYDDQDPVSHCGLIATIKTCRLLPVCPDKGRLTCDTIAR